MEKASGENFARATRKTDENEGRLGPDTKHIQALVNFRVVMPTW